jgi:hypothetical protein
MHTHSVPLDSAPSQIVVGGITLLRRRASRLVLRLVKFMTWCADYHAACVQYDDLSGRSRNELGRLGIEQGDVHRHINVQ